jgi:histidinol-phosphate aminotransferase
MKKSGADQNVRPDLKALKGYSAHTAPESMKARFGLEIDEIIKLDANENPYGCSDRVIEAISNYRYYHIYPDALQQELRQQLSIYTGVPASNIIAGAGADQLIDLIIRLVVNPGDEIINLTPTFGMYEFYARLSGANIVNINRNTSFDIDTQTVQDSITPRTRLIFLANPNNPSGTLTAREDIKRLLDTGVLVVVDEAYYEFSRESVAHWLGQYDNLIVLRTFSKWAGLAGLRIGYGLFDEKLAGYLMRIKDPYNINTAAQLAALASLSDQHYLLGQVEQIISERERLFAKLGQITGLIPYPSRANFILCRIVQGRADWLVRMLKQRGILVRYYDTQELKDFIRISVGKPEQNDVTVESIIEIMAEAIQC